MVDSIAGLRVLIVEDEFLIAMMLEEMLMDLGCIVAATAAKPSQAHSIIASEQIDAAVLDVNLGGIDSFEIAAALREKQIPFLFATGYGGSRVPPEFSGYEFLQKPYRMQELADGLSRLPLAAVNHANLSCKD